MRQECPLLAKCGFLKKYCKTHPLECKGFVRLYCKGPKLAKCQRRKHLSTNLSAPPDDMMPNGNSVIPRTSIKSSN